MASASITSIMRGGERTAGPRVWRVVLGIAVVVASGCTNSSAPDHVGGQIEAGSTSTTAATADPPASDTTAPTTTTTTNPPLVSVVNRPALDWAPAPDRVGDVDRLAFTEGTRMVLQTAGGNRTFVPGVNLGPTVPGRSPGEVAVGADEYRRWFPAMSALGFRLIRIYTILPPVFYDELAAYNRANPSAPLYLVHGVWVPEEGFYETGDIFSQEVVSQFRAEIADAVGVVHGSAEIPARPGHASGTYTTDVSEWLAGWLIGVEWEPHIIRDSEEGHPDRTSYSGDFFVSLDGATPTEVWLAEMMDHLAAESTAHGTSVPAGFVNWPVTDPLPHPDSPDPGMRMVDIDANNIQQTDAWPGGYFASYHAYPYYPDFYHFEAGLADFEYNGRIDPYAGYLTALRDHHADIPVLITEFGVPAGMGLARQDPLGRHQGNLSEQDQMRINAEMLAMIHDLDLAGGFVFEWIDEWFKLTWNTLDYELPPERRQMWFNTWTNESNFGVIAADPGDQTRVVIDGDGSDWVANGSEVIWSGGGVVREVRATHDEGFLYLNIEFGDGVALDTDAVTIGIDILDGPAGEHRRGPRAAAEYAAVLGPGTEGRMEVRSDIDPFLVQFGFVHDFFEVSEDDVFGDDQWNIQRLLVRRPLVIPTTGEMHGVQSYEVGRLLHGTTDPNDTAFDSRSVWSATGDSVEIRLPHMSIGFSDPSSLQAYVVDAEGVVTHETVDRVGISVAVGDEVVFTDGYTWEPWTTVGWQDRAKAGIDVLSDQLWAIVEGRTDSAATGADE